MFDRYALEGLLLSGLASGPPGCAVLSKSCSNGLGLDLPGVQCSADTVILCHVQRPVWLCMQLCLQLTVFANGFEYVQRPVWLCTG